MHDDDKLGILDVRILLKDNTQIDTEIQLSELKIWADRALFYISKMYTLLYNFINDAPVS